MSRRLALVLVLLATVLLATACSAPPSAVRAPAAGSPILSQPSSLPAVNSPIPGVAASSPSPATASPVATTAAVAPTASPTTVTRNPAALAGAVFAAKNDDARYAAILDVMRALPLGVYDGSTGAAIVRGFERNSKDIYLYSIEIKAMVSGFGRGKLRDLPYLANMFYQAGFRSNGGKIDPEMLRQRLYAAVQSSAAAPQDDMSRVMLLVRELGLRHAEPYDLLQNVPQEQIKLDPLQTLLLAADVFGPVMSKAAQAAPNRTVALAAFHPDAAPCQGFISNLVGGNMTWGKWSLALAFGEPMTMAALIGDMFHGMAMGVSIDVSEVGQALHRTHYAPGDHAELAGAEVRYRIKVEMLDDYGETIINCLGAAGFNIPKKGPIPDIPVLWVTHGLEEHGTITYDPPSQKTDANGISTMIFKPKVEKRPNAGPLIRDERFVDALALYQSALGNVPGSVAQFSLGELITFATTVSWHQNLTLEIALDGATNTGDGQITWGPNKVKIPLERGEGNFKGSYKGSFDATVTGECSATVKYPTEFDVVASGDGPMAISIKSSIGYAMVGVCEDEGFSYNPAPVRGSINLSLELQDGASKTLSGPSGGPQFTFTLRFE